MIQDKTKLEKVKEIRDIVIDVVLTVSILALFGMGIFLLFCIVVLDVGK